MIKQMSASMWVDETETLATVYVSINNSKDDIYFTFDVNDQQDGVIRSKRCRSKATRRNVSGVSATLTLPYDEDGDFEFAVTPEGEDTATMKLNKCTNIYHPDGTRNYRRPIADGKYNDDGVTFAKWFTGQ